MALPIDGQPAERHPTIVHYFSGLGIISLGLVKFATKPKPVTLNGGIYAVVNGSNPVQVPRVPKQTPTCLRHW
jgi:hypothetical protein